MKCNKCGFETNSKFCEKCGNKLKKKNNTNLLIEILIGVLLLIGIAFSFLNFFNNSNNKKEPVTMYVFYAGYCGYCNALHDYLDNDLSLDSNYKNKFKVEYIRIADENGLRDNINGEMFAKVTDYYNYKEGSIPFYVIGDKYGVGYSETLKVKIKDMINEAYNDSNYKDIVSTLIDKDKINKY